jgi:8-oxo-dGTP pyrophosphatase MutT (NUDIX family)
LRIKIIIYLTFNPHELDGEPLLKDYYIEKLRKKLQKTIDEKAFAAVALLVKCEEENLKFFLVKRAEVLGDPWSGDMAFPGGKRCEEDQSLFDTVYREVMEETMINLKDTEFLGAMRPINSSVRPDMMIQPLVYRVFDEPVVKLNQELTKALWASIDEIKENRTKDVVKNWKNIDIFKVQGETVWGLTYRMLNQFIQLLDED